MIRYAILPGTRTRQVSRHLRPPTVRWPVASAACRWREAGRTRPLIIQPNPVNVAPTSSCAPFSSASSQRQKATKTSAVGTYLAAVPRQDVTPEIVYFRDNSSAATGDDHLSNTILPFYNIYI